ncbi:MAG: 50S ribosomal protein L25 [Candidatus Neomarinimicrobiota bacterium]|nr:MAG: 50S ribosomal protein L25 [Candidatus Neomarinimicrobiota bacterium]
MAEYYHLDVVERKRTRTAGARSLRREGRIPVNYYYHGEKNHNLSIDRKALYAALHSGNHVFEIGIDGSPHYVMIKEVQYHPVTDEIIHVDLMRVRRKEKMTIAVPVSFEGQAAGVKKGGVMIENLSHLEISCLPTEVPESIAIDITELEIGHALTAGDVTLPDNIELVTDPELTVVTVQAPKTHVEEEAPAAEEGEAPLAPEPEEDTETEE